MNTIHFSERRSGPIISLPIQGMNCAGCVGRVESALAKVDGVNTVSVNLATERAEIHARGDIDKMALVEAVEKAGYHVPVQSIELDVQGMNCASCVGRVEKALAPCRV